MYRISIALALVCIGCGSEGPDQIGGSSSRGAVAEPPDQYACERDEDCTLAPWHFEEVPCCNASYTAVQAARFVTWRDAWQAAECADVDCDAVRAERESSLPPSLPMPCYFEPRCTRGQCGGSCGP